MSKYNKLIQKIYKLNINSIKLGLDNIKLASKTLDLEKALLKIKFIHIAGTNGKGSTASIINTLFTSLTNKNIGLYTSPHLLKFNERIRVNNKLITNKEIAVISELIFKKCKNIKLSFFEFTTLICLIYFIEKKVDIAVIETGLGGRLDATNIIPSSVAIITSIAYDHQQYLGNTLKAIAKEKAGIFKKNNIVILADTLENKILRNIAKEKKVKKIHELNKDFNYTINKNKTFNLYFKKQLVYKNIKSPLKGAHQYSNTSLALLCFYMFYKNYKIEEINIALAKTKWTARLETLDIKTNLKKLYLDVSHNTEGVEKTINYFKNTYKNKKIICMLSFMKDKDYTQMLKQFTEISNTIILFPSNIRGRKLSYIELKNTFIDNKNILIYKSMKEALKTLIKYKNKIGLISGSIYNVEKVYKNLKNDYNYKLNI